MKRLAFVLGIVVAVSLLAAMTVLVALYAQGKQDISGSASGNEKVITVDGHQYRQKPGIVSVCLIGEDKDSTAPRDGYNGQADMIMVLAIDTESGDITGIVIPRDSMVEVDRTYTGEDTFYDTRELQVCLAYAYGTDDASSSEMVCTAVSRILYNVPMDYYYTLRMDGVGELTDAAGGVTLKALATIPGTSIAEGDIVTLDGQEALQYVWWRDEDSYGSAIDRQERQEQFVKSLAGKLLDRCKRNPLALVSVMRTMRVYSTTNISNADAVFLGVNTAMRMSEPVELVSLEGVAVYDDRSQWEQYRLDDDAVLETVLSVYYEPISGDY